MEVDATEATLVIDLKNSIDENYHFEVSPTTTLEQARRLAAPQTNGPGDKTEHGTYVQMNMPLVRR